MMLELRRTTSDAWRAAVLADLDAFLQDHAANERKVSGSALKLAVQYPERTWLVGPMIDLAREELEHFRRVHDLLRERGRTLGQDAPDPYMGRLRRVLRRMHVEEYLLDRLLAYAVVEARACERFGLLAEALDPGPLQRFYAMLVRAEARHGEIFLQLASHVADAAHQSRRLQEILDAEGEIVRTLPARAALH